MKDDDGACDSHGIADENSEYRENEERGDEGEQHGGGEEGEECYDRECGENPGGAEGCIKTDINSSQILEDICTEAPSGPPPTQLLNWVLDGYDTSTSNDLVPHAATSGMYIFLSCSDSEWYLFTTIYTRF
jgi:hypothetical protein